MKQLLRAFPSELVNEHRVRNKSRGSQLRQVVAAKPERNLKLSELQLKDELQAKDELQLKERPLARKRRNPLESDHEVVKARVHRNDRKTNEFD